MKALCAAFLAIGAALPVQAADAARGKQLFEQCAACHSLNEGEDGLGPSLAGTIGRKAGTHGTFRYSPAMKRSGIVWSAETLDTFLADPQKAVPANRMPFSGMPEAQDRADVIEYLVSAVRSPR